MIRRRMTVKRVDPWSVLKLGLVINIAGAAILVITGMVVWSVVRRLQLVERICEPATNLLGLESCTVNGVELMRTSLLLAGLLVVVATGVMVFSAFLYNLIADLTGGIEVSMLDHAGQMRTASGGVEVAPELRTTGSVATSRTGRTTGTGRPVGTPVQTGATGPVMVPVDNPTIASAAARPNTAVPLLVEDDEPPSALPAVPEVVRPGVLDRAAAAGAMVKGAADRTGAALSEAGRRATTALTEVTEREAADRAQRTEAARQSLDDLQATPDRTPGNGGPADAARVPGSSGRSRHPGSEDQGASSWPSREAAGDPRRAADASEPRDPRRMSRADGSGSDRPASDRPGSDRTRSGTVAPDRAGSERSGSDRSGSDRSGSDRSRAGSEGSDGAGADRSGRSSAGPGGSDAPSPQEAAAARVRAQSSSESSAPPRDSDGRFVSAEATPDDLFGSHPKRSEDDRGRR